MQLNRAVHTQPQNATTSNEREYQIGRSSGAGSLYLASQTFSGVNLNKVIAGLVNATPYKGTCGELRDTRRHTM
jgi:hypothetical protein